MAASLRNVAYALLSGADGWMFDGEDALGQVDTMSLDSQRNLKLAITRDPAFLKVAEPVASEMNRWGQGFLGRPFPPLTNDPADAAGLTLLEPAPRTIGGARDLLSIGLQYANAFLRGFQAATLKAADHFGDDDSLYSFEDMATGEIRLSILWEWLNKGAPFTEAEPALGVRPGDPMTAPLFNRLLEEEYGKLLRAGDRDIHDDSKPTTLPIAKTIAQTYGPGLVERVRKLAPTGVDAALDIAGSSVIPELIELVGDPSRVLSVADFTAPQYGAQLSLMAQKHPERVLVEAARLFSEGAFRVALAKTFPLAQAAEAYQRCAAGHVTGKLVISIT